MKTKLEFVPTLIDAFAIGTKNIASLVLTVVFYVLTCWIPYLNVGTTIALASLPGKLASGKVINPTYIFDAVYRKNMGNFFLLLGLELMILFPAFLFGIVPGYVLSIAYSLALYIMVDDGITPMDALHSSYKATDGYKWKIFFLELAFGIISGILFLIISGIANLINVGFITFVLYVLLIMVVLAASIALSAFIYRELWLKKDQVEEVSETAAEL